MTQLSNTAFALKTQTYDEVRHRQFRHVLPQAKQSPTGPTYHVCGCRDNPHQPMAPRRRGSRVPSLRSVLMQPTLLREYLFVSLAVRELSLRDASPGSESSPLGRFSGRRPCTRSAIVRWQEATDPQSPEGGSQRACHTEGAHPTASGRFSTVALFKQSYPALAVRKLSLWVASPGETSRPLPHLVGSWVAALRYLSFSVDLPVPTTLTRDFTVFTNVRCSLFDSERTTSLPSDSVRRDAYGASSAFAFRDSHSLAITSSSRGTCYTSAVSL